MRILIVAATETEIAPLLERMISLPTGDLSVDLYSRGSHEIDVLITGIGMVATAAWCSRALAQTPYDGRLDGGARRTDELTHFLELGHDGLALDSELLGELVDPDLRHSSPDLGPVSGVDPDHSDVHGHAHRWAFMSCSCPVAPDFWRTSWQVVPG